MKWLITGGSGFTGKYLVSTMHNKFHKDNIIILDVIPPRFKLSDQVEFKEINLLNEKKVCQILAKESPDRIIHLAGLMRDENPLQMVKINVLSCGILFESIQSNKIPIDGFLVIGSAAQYGQANPENPPTEENPCIPTSFYGYLKLVQEKLALEYHQKYDLPVICVRPSNLIGPHMPSSFVVPRIICQLVSSTKNSTSGIHKLSLYHIKASRDFIDVRDVSEAYIQLFSNPKTRGEIFNIGTNKLISLVEIIDKIKKFLGIKNLEIIKEEPRLDFDSHLTDSLKIQSFIPWEPKIELETTLKDMIEALL